MSYDEKMQWAAICGGLLVFVCLLALLVRWLRKLAAIWPDCAKKLGLVFREENTGNAFTSRTMRQKCLEGVVSAVPVRLVSSRETIGRTTQTQTRVHARLPVPAATAFSVQIARGAQRAASYHRVPTGEPDFDRRVALSSDAPDAVKAQFGAEVRAAILRLPMSVVGLSSDRAEVCVSYAGEPDTLQALEALIALGVAAAQTRFQPEATEPIQPRPVAEASAATMDLQAYLEQLGNGHGFTVQQLAANRAGQIHPEQRAGLRSGVGGVVSIVLALVSLAGGVGGAMLLYVDFRKPIDRLDMNGIYLLATAGVVLAVLFSALSTVMFIKAARRRRAYRGQPTVVEGAVQKVQIRGQIEVFSYNIGKHSFFAPRKGWELVTHGARYRVYCVAGDLLSIEPL